MLWVRASMAVELLDKVLAKVNRSRITKLRRVEPRIAGSKSKLIRLPKQFPLRASGEARNELRSLGICGVWGISLKEGKTMADPLSESKIGSNSDPDVPDEWISIAAYYIWKSD